MTTTLNLLRLERYAAVLEQLKGRKHLSLGTLLLHIKSISADQVQQDLRALGVRDASTIQVTEVRLVLASALRQARQAAGAVGAGGPSRLIAAADAERAMQAGKPGSLKKTHIREAAWNCVVDQPDHFLLAQGRMARQMVAFPHQLETVNAVLARYCGQAIVADEVGLGKTLIGALLAFEILERRADSNVLILTPANLVGQWIDEFERFFGFDLRRLPHAGAAELAEQRVVLVSIDRAKGGDLAPMLLARRWDLLLIDEAHEIRTQESRKAMFTFSLHALNRVYLTATPVQNTGYDIYHVANSLRPGFLNVKADFTNKYMADERSVREPEVLQSQLSAILTRMRRKDVGKEGFARRRIKTVKIENWTEQERAAYDDLLDMLRGVYRRNLGYAAPIQRGSGGEDHISQFVLVAMLILREMSSHTKAALKTLDVSLRDRLQKMAKAIQGGGSRSAARGVSDHEWGLQQLDRFIAMHGRDLNRPEAHAKVEALLVQLHQLFKKKRSVLIYVCFRESLALLTSLIERELGQDVVVLDYHGEMREQDKTKRIALFQKSRPACLVSTDAGGQGLNLQAADTVINYDFPWNPMRVEQRIGRVDRYGQTAREITVLNLVNTGTIERYVYDTLRTKIEMFEHVVGNITSPLNVEDILENRLMLGIGELILSSRSTEEMRQRFQGLDEASLRVYMDRYERHLAGRERWIDE